MLDEQNLGKIARVARLLRISVTDSRFTHFACDKEGEVLLHAVSVFRVSFPFTALVTHSSAVSVIDASHLCQVWPFFQFIP